MPHEMRMPALGQTSDELRIVSWLKSEGESVKMGEPLLEVETDKAVLTVESAYNGTVLKILYPADKTLESGTVIAYVGQPGESVDASDGVSPQVPKADSDGAHAPAPEAASAPVAVPSGGPVLASPVARQIAREHGIDLASVHGSGPGGRIERRDIEALIGGAAPAATPASPTTMAAQAEYTDRDVPRHRQAIAQRLTRSAQTIPQIALMASVDMTLAKAVLDALRAAGLGGLTYTHLILRAVARALRAHPTVNMLWGAEGPKLRTLTRANVGLAVAGDDTLLVATIAEPDQQPLPQLVQAVTGATQRGRASALSQADIAPAAITVSNLGMRRVDAFVAIVDPDQTAILAVGRVADAVAALNGGVQVVPRVALTLTVDHRVADGATAAAFLEAICEDLERGVA
jgi:pyruvate dehydrogenase E2 component (dihydrolipoamide acetyltransferase)